MATGRRIGHRCKEVGAAKQHEIQPQLRARASFGMPLPNQRIITLRPDPGVPNPRLCVGEHNLQSTGASILVRTSFAPIRTAFDTNRAKTGTSNHP